MERLSDEDMPYFLNANTAKRSADAVLDFVQGVLVGKYSLRDGDQITQTGEILRLRAVGPRPLPTAITPDTPLPEKCAWCNRFIHQDPEGVWQTVDTGESCCMLVEGETTGFHRPRLQEASNG